MEPIYRPYETANLETIMADHLIHATDQVQTTQALRTLETQISELRSELGQLFQIEVQRRDQINQQLAELTGGAEDLAQTPLGVRNALYAAGYDSWVSLEPLAWRHPETRLPQLAMFSLKSPKVRLTMEWPAKGVFSWTSSLLDKPSLEIEPSLPGPLFRCFADLLELLSEAPYKPEEDVLSSIMSTQVTLEATFTGIIPGNSRQKIRDAINSGLFGSGDFATVFLLTEVEEWSRKEPIYIRRDPIAVGWNQAFPDRLWYIDSFDTTPLENRIAFRS